MMQQHKDQTQELKQRQMQNTIELQYRQLKALHDLKWVVLLYSEGRGVGGVDHNRKRYSKVMDTMPCNTGLSIDLVAY